MRFRNNKSIETRMKRIFPIISLLFFNIFTSNAQEVTSVTAKEIIPVIRFKDNIQVKFGGWVRAEYYVDSREMVGAVDDLFGFFPENENFDANSNDLNAVVRQNLSVQATRFNALFSGPSFLNAKSSAFFEFDFTGGNTVAARFRHGWAKLTWEKSELLIGKTWNPFAETPFPTVVGLHTGIPFRPFGRADQIRFSYMPCNNIRLLLAAAYQSEHKTPIEKSAEGDMRANPIPELHLQLHYKNPNFSAGLLSEFKTLRPATQTTGTAGVFKTNEKLTSFGLATYADYRLNLFNAKVSLIYGQNLSELFQQGGYAVKSLNSETGHRTYTASNSASAWVNLTYGRTWILGLFAGYQKNLGFEENILVGGDFFGRWQNVDHTYRIAPSLQYSYKQWVFQAEIDCDMAAYGTIDYTNKAKVIDAKEILGVRGLFATTFLF